MPASTTGPLVSALRLVLDEPSKYKTIRFRAEAVLDQWLKRHD